MKLIYVLISMIILGGCQGEPEKINLSRQMEEPFTEYTRELGEIESYEAEGVYIHIYEGTDGASVNTVVIESENKLVVIDTQHFLSRAQEARAFVDYLGKPVEMVIISHSHRDHYMGAREFADLPIYATRETVDNMRREGEKIRREKIEEGPPFTEEYPEEIVYPEYFLEPEFTVDGIGYEVWNTEYAENIDGIVIKMDRTGAVYAGDLVEERAHLLIADPESYLRVLGDIALLEDEGYELIISGHGGVYPFDILEDHIEYVEAARDILERGVSSEEYMEEIEEAFPEYGGAGFVVDIMRETPGLFKE